MSAYVAIFTRADDDFLTRSESVHPHILASPIIGSCYCCHSFSIGLINQFAKLLKKGEMGIIVGVKKNE